MVMRYALADWHRWSAQTVATQAPLTQAMLSTIEYAGAGNPTTACCPAGALKFPPKYVIRVGCPSSPDPLAEVLALLEAAY